VSYLKRTEVVEHLPSKFKTLVLKKKKKAKIYNIHTQEFINETSKKLMVAEADDMCMCAHVLFSLYLCFKCF
jgi:hypothetical protein